MRRILLMFLANFFRLPYMLFKLFHMTNHIERYSREERYKILQRIVRWANKGGKVEVLTEGTENIPTEGTFIFYPNHQGMYDTLTMIQAVDRPFSPIAKIETEKVFLLGRVLQMLDAEFMDRADIRQSLGVITRTASRAKAGDNFVIYAEGTRSRKGNEMNPFKPGAFKAATLSHASIVPVALVDCFVPFDQPSVRKTTVQAHFLPPISYEVYKDMTTAQIAELVQEQIRKKISECTASDI